MNKIMFDFPLCCLSYPADDKDKIGLIISYCIVEHSKKIKTNVENRVNYYLDENKSPAGFSKKLLSHKRLLLAGEEIGISLGYIPQTISSHETLSNYIHNYKLKNGNDSYCRTGKSLCFETRDNQFPFRQFAVLCAIQSILGKTKKFKRITKDRIRFAMLGYKSKEVALKELKGQEKLLSDRQLGTVIDTLHAKKFFSKFTYANRQTFFSTRLNDNELFEAVKSSKIYWAKKKTNLMDKQVTDDIKTELGKLKLIRFVQHSKTGTGS
ncbi:MAG TPA: hypothetical protein PL018_12310 [Ignavibacteriaceae bacterium]|nr:hypothetical protein [Ignavibacteriaceae bacterium]